MHTLYRIIVGTSQCVQSAVELMMETVIISVGTSSLSGSFYNSYSNNTCKPWPCSHCM